MEALTRSSSPNAERMNQIVQELFPMDLIPIDDNSMKQQNEKAPGSDGISAKAHNGIPATARDIQHLLGVGIFPYCQKWQGSRRSTKAKDTLSCRPHTHRSACLKQLGKKLEKLIGIRLTESIRAAGNLSPREFDFKTERSAVGVFMEVVNAVHRAKAHSHRCRFVVLFVSFISEMLQIG